MKDKTRYLHCAYKYVTIKEHGREIGGGFGLVHDVFWREEKPWVVLKLPTGRRLTIPAALTDLPPKMFSTTEGRMEFDASALLQVAEFCHHLLLLQLRRPALKRRPSKPTRK